MLSKGRCSWCFKAVDVLGGECGKMKCICLSSLGKRKWEKLCGAGEKESSASAQGRNKGSIKYAPGQVRVSVAVSSSRTLEQLAGAPVDCPHVLHAIVLALECSMGTIACGHEV